jgi:putative ABC transport system ATP-binding protein
MEPSVLIKASGVWKVFGQGENRVEALRGIDFTIQNGEMIAIMGPSGCGKTTLIHCLSGIDSISRGSILMEGQDLHQMKEKERDLYRLQKMGFVFQTYNLIPVLSAVENVELPLLAQGISFRTARRQAMEILTQIGLKNRMHHRPAELSGGQAQRVALARAIINKPRIIWADEPTGALDRESGKMILDLFDHFHRINQTTIVIVTHDPKVAERTERIIYLDSGQIIQERFPKLKKNITYS